MNGPTVRSRLPLVGVDGNAYAIMGHVTRGLRQAGATTEQVAAFQAEATSGDYDNLLQTAIRWTEEDAVFEVLDHPTARPKGEKE